MIDLSNLNDLDDSFGKFKLCKQLEDDLVVAHRNCYNTQISEDERGNHHSNMQKFWISMIGRNGMMHLTKANSPIYICRFREPKRVGEFCNGAAFIACKEELQAFQHWNPTVEDLTQPVNQRFFRDNRSRKATRALSSVEN
ncbi:hypothetical protein F2Q69_00051063 [Brassica cretica]|uniref:Uncharacterized protein n=1 Tax=Brassica cretica TaxID=69181 RepID=A0A8S9PUY4_BRACR|nr:hypothetical protein F2Q69_00051063 [Brassica cretica]